MRNIALILCILLGAGCSLPLTPELVEALAKDAATLCLSTDVRGGAGTLVPAPGVGGGYGSATLVLCRTNQPDARLSVHPDGSISIEHGKGVQ